MASLKDLKAHMAGRLAMSVLLALSLVAPLVGCSSGPQDEVIGNAIKETDSTIRQGAYVLDTFEVTNSYTREIGGETVYVYDYAGNVVAKNEMVTREGFPANGKIEGTISVVQRGDAWYTF